MYGLLPWYESSQLDVEPAKYFVLVTKREKRACRSCEELGVVSAPLPPRIIVFVQVDRGMKETAWFERARPAIQARPGSLTRIISIPVN